MSIPPAGRTILLPAACLALAVLLLLHWESKAAEENPVVATFAFASSGVTADTAGLVDAALEAAAGAVPGVVPASWDDVFGVSEPPDVRQSRQKGLLLLEQGKRETAEMMLGSAQQSLKSSLEAFDAMGPYFNPEQGWIEAMINFGVVQHLSGNEAKGTASLVTAAAMSQRIAAAAAGSMRDPFAMEALNRAIANAATLPRGSLNITSRPAAALAYVDGVFRGATPIDVDGLAGGAHFVAIRKRGYLPFGQWIRNEAGNVRSVEVALTPTPRSVQFESLFAMTAAQFGGSKVTQAMRDLASLANARWIVGCAVDATAENLVLTCVSYDVKIGVSISRGKEKVARGGTDLFSAAADLGAKFITQSFTDYSAMKARMDPLDEITGTEDWQENPPAAAAPPAPQPPAGYAPGLNLPPRQIPVQPQPRP